MKPTDIAIIRAAFLAAFVLLEIPASAQQPATAATGAPPAGRGGGFTQPDPIDFEDHTGWISMFDGRTLNGWDGDKAYWHIEDGTIAVESTCEKPTGTIYLIWQGGEAADFELKMEMKGEGAGVN